MADIRICSVDGCDKHVYSRGWCNGHYRKWTRWGNPKGKHASEGEPLRFLLATVQSSTDDCVDWPYARTGQRYGVILFEGKPQATHRVVCKLVHGEPPSAEHVAAHSCNRGPDGCINPRHLRWATQTENVQDYQEWRRANAA